MGPRTWKKVDVVHAVKTWQHERSCFEAYGHGSDLALVPILYPKPGPLGRARSSPKYGDLHIINSIRSRQMRVHFDLIILLTVFYSPCSRKTRVRRR